MSTTQFNVQIDSLRSQTRGWGRGIIVAAIEVVSMGKGRGKGWSRSSSHSP